MKHYAGQDFWDAYKKLPPNVQRLADKQFDLLKANPSHPSLRLKRVKSAIVARIGLHYRAVAREVEGNLVWAWIGTHAEYDRIINESL